MKRREKEGENYAQLVEARAEVQGRGSKLGLRLRLRNLKRLERMYFFYFNFFSIYTYILVFSILSDMCFNINVL